MRHPALAAALTPRLRLLAEGRGDVREHRLEPLDHVAVSYTHLTLPTNREV